MQEKIGETAGRVWSILREKQSVNIAQLPRMLKEKSVIVYLAVGWLSRENKIEYTASGDKTLISLARNERN